MTLRDIQAFCLAFDNVEEAYPFDNTTLVFKVHQKIFALINVVTASSINLKCDPEKALQLRERYDAVTGGYHMNKKHWNTIQLDGSVPSHLIQEWITDSYHLVAFGKNKKSTKK